MSFDADVSPAPRYARFSRRLRGMMLDWAITLIVMFSAVLVAVTVGSDNFSRALGILVVIGAALLLVVGVKPYVAPNSGKALMAFALFTTAVIFNVAAIANNNLQDLKTGQLVDATPWKQQVALVIGVIAGAGARPLLLGGLTWFAVAAASLLMQAFTQQL